MSESANVKKHVGGCFCGDVRFEAELDISKPVSHCNCTLCVKRQAATAMMKPAAFRLLSDESKLTAWKTQIGEMLFCKRCGIHVFGRGHLAQLGGDYVAVNANCVDDVDPAKLTMVYFDGRHNNWHAGPRPTPWPVHAA
jgi:hypothetical protein